MRTYMKSSVSALAALFLGSTALATIPAFAAPGGVEIAQAEPERRGGGDRGGEDRGPRGGDRGDRGGEPRTERAPRDDAAPRQERAPRSSQERAPRSSLERESRAERDRTITRRDAAPERRDDRRDDRRYSRDRRDDDRRYRMRPGYRPDFMFMGGPRVVVRGYGPNWCRGLHRGYHFAPRIGWHAANHRGLFRC